MASSNIVNDNFDQSFFDWSLSVYRIGRRLHDLAQNHDAGFDRRAPTVYDTGQDVIGKAKSSLEKLLVVPHLPMLWALEGVLDVEVQVQ